MTAEAPEQDNSLAELNVFAEKEGYSAHIKITGVAFNKAVVRLDALITALEQHNYVAGRRPGGGSGGPPSGPEQAKPQEGPSCPTCQSATEYKEGASARGPWKAWFCLATKNAPRGQGHKAVFV